MYGGSYSGGGYDHYLDRYDESPLERVKQQYWTAKQAIMTKLGKKEDESLVASDAELDAKLAVFGSIKATSENLLKCIEHYQDYIGDLAHEENALGRFLKSRGKADKTQAGKLMASVGRAQSYTAQQRLALRVPLVRLYQELDVFTRRAVLDCYCTVDAALKARNEYRGSLLRMKDVSQQLDPDTYKQMEKFRNVQTQVRKNKAKFDKLKLDCLQKIDLLAASRCNLFSQILTNYHTCLMKFWDKTAKAHRTISESFNETHRYEFTVLKDLAEAPAGAGGGNENDSAMDGGELITLSAGGATDENLTRSESLERLFKDSPTHEGKNAKDGIEIFEPRTDETGQIWPLTDVENSRQLAAPFGLNDAFSQPSPEVPGNDTSAQFVDQLWADAIQETPDNSFSKQWQQAFGLGSGLPSSASTAGNIPGSHEFSARTMMPSQLLDSHFPASVGRHSAADGSTFNPVAAAAPRDDVNKNKAKSKPKDRSAWFNLFADIDPLQNPDAVGKTNKDTDRGC